MFNSVSPSPITTRELKRMSIIRRYATVTYDLPYWAKEALSLKMGSIEVTPKDSFELYLSNLRGAYPCCDFVVFQKRFSEIFSRKAYIVLRKLIKNRENNAEFYVSNDYFWQEFKELFTVPTNVVARSKFLSSLETRFWNLWNKKVRGILGYNRAVAKVGLTGVGVSRRFSGKKKSQQVYPVKWR